MNKSSLMTCTLKIAVIAFGISFMYNNLQAKPRGSDSNHFIFEVEQGNTLEGLSKTYTGNPNNWHILQNLNGVADPYKMPIGTLLKIPLSLIPRASSTAKVVHVKGNVQHDNTNATKDEYLKESSLIQTGNNSFITIELSDQSQITVLPNTELELEQLQKFSGAGITDSVIRIKNGTVESDVAPNGEGVGRFEIRTPITITGVRGTRLKVSKDDNGTNQEVLKGNINTKSLALQQSQNIPQGYGASYNQQGELRSYKKLLAAPEISSSKKNGGSWLIKYKPVSDAVKYKITISSDKNGMLIESSQTTTKLEKAVSASTGGTHYIAIRAIDKLGLEGNITIVAAEFDWGVVSSDDQAVVSGFGLLIQRSTYE